MKALTICQPYPHLIIRGEKLVENREWSTHYRGPLAIHAGKSRRWLSDDDEAHFATEGDPLQFGVVLGEARLTDVVHIERVLAGAYDMQYPWLRRHPHANGAWCWILQDVHRYAAPIPFKGAQGLWEFPTSASN